MRHGIQSGPTPVVIGRIRPFLSCAYNTEMVSARVMKSHVPGLTARKILSIFHVSRAGGIIATGLRGMQSFRRARRGSLIHTRDEGSQFWFLVPSVGDLTFTDEQHCHNAVDNAKTSLTPRSNPQNLFFRVFSGRFRLGRTQHAATQIPTESGEVAGTLDLHQELQLLSYNTALNLNMWSQTIELIVLFGNTTSKESFDVWPDKTMDLQTTCGRSRHNRRNETLYRAKDIYNVVWIDRIGGIHCLKATGVADRDIWDEHVLEKPR